MPRQGSTLLEVWDGNSGSRGSPIRYQPPFQIIETGEQLPLDPCPGPFTKSKRLSSISYNRGNALFMSKIKKYRLNFPTRHSATLRIIAASEMGI